MNPRSRPFKQVDVFGAGPYLGNPLAVVLDGEGLSSEQMGHFARWTHLSETTFLLPPTHPEADYRLRIFTPGRELPFAGHPTLGSAHAWLEAGGQPQTPGQLVQECAAGLVRLRLEGTRLFFAAPPLLRAGSVDPDTLEQLTRGLGLSSADIVQAQWVDNGPGWVAVLLHSAGAVLALEPDIKALHPLEVGVVGPHPAGSECAFEVRAFVTSGGPSEDPVTGSLNASLAQWLMAEGLAPERYTAAQGTVLGCQGRVTLERDPAGQVWVGGDSVTCVDGQVTL